MQASFFDNENRLEKLQSLGDPLPKLDCIVDWEGFRPILRKVYKKRSVDKGGRPAYDVVLMFKVLVLQHLYNLSDDQTEYQIRDRHSFCRFLKLTPEGNVPDSKTIWLCRERLKKRELLDQLFEQLNRQIDAAGFRPKKGQIIDASMVPAPRQRNTRDENKQVKSGETPEQWQDKPAKLSQKDTQARWTKKHGSTYYGYKNHISVDRKHKLIRQFEVTDAAVHDSQVFDVLLDADNSSADVWADSAYRSKATEESLKHKGYRSHIHRKGSKSKPLNDRGQKANSNRSKVRVRVEHIFATQQAMGGKLVRTIGLERARFKIAMTNIVYNMKRMSSLIPAT